jgi:hypothetical protein
MKTNILKFAIAILILLLFKFPVTAQYYMWSEPQQATDSLTDNRNPLIIDLQFNGTNDYFIFWEKSEDASATSICYKRFYEPEEPVVLKQAPNVHFRNVQVINVYYYYSDTLFYLFYESDQNGNFDIYYQVYTEQGFGDPVLFAGSPEDETHFRCEPNGGLVWLQGDKVRTSTLDRWNSPYHFTDPITIDSIGCYSPAISEGNSRVAWLKSVDGNNHIYYSDNFGSGWSAPQLLYDIGDNASLNFATSTCGWTGGFGDVIVWENIFDGIHTIVAHNFWDEDFIAGFSQDGLYQPEIAVYFMPVDNFLFESFMTFVNLEEGNGDIYVSDWTLSIGISPYIEEYANISNTANQESNPRFFNGQCVWESCELIDIWESNRSNGHWQLYYSINGEIGCQGGTPESNLPALPQMDISPNPARSSCDVNYTLKEDDHISLDLITMDGRQIRLVDNEFRQKGEYSYHLDIEKLLPGGAASGIFLVKLQSSGGAVTKRLVIAR